MTAHWSIATALAVENMPGHGQPATHRLNRFEYGNVVQDLLGLEVDVRSLLPSDDAANGFDNNAALLSMSSSLLERYLTAAHKISRLAVGDPTNSPAFETQTVALFNRQDRRIDDAPFGSRGGTSFRYDFPLDGDYVIRIRLRGTGGGEPEVRINGALPEVVSTPESSAKKPDAAARTEREIKLHAHAGVQTVTVYFPERRAVSEGFEPDHLPSIQVTSDYAKVANVAVGGPFNPQGAGDTASRRRIFICRPASEREEESCARRILANLGRLAYRRPVDKVDVDSLMEFYRKGRRNGGFEGGVQQALERMLVDVEFLFRIPSSSITVSRGNAARDFELASRLSFFLWSSIPDDELLEVAAREKLHDPVVLERETRRMMADRRFDRLISNFGEQWLYLRNLRAVAPDPNAFPSFDDSIREEFQRETALFLASQIHEDRPVTDVLSANYTFLNEQLARHYGINNVYGERFRRVQLTDPNRMGLLGQGSLLTVTSTATRTSPVVRGKWILENLLGVSAPAPPANVPALTEPADAPKPTTVREAMVAHRDNPVCAACHKLLDPMGFALENFDGIGRWRNTEAGVSIDPSGQMPDGTKFNNAAEMRQALLKRSGQIFGTLTKKLFVYALGRDAEKSDNVALGKIALDAAPGNYRWSSIILGIVRSAPFQSTETQS
jgi:hypothetical protein